MTDSDTRRMSRDAALDVLARRRDEQIVVSTMTTIGPWRERAGTDRDLICVGFMGGASTLGLGVALARPEDDVWVFDGDGSLSMQLGSLVTISNAAPRRFLHVVFHNGVYETSGGQPLPGEGRVSFAAMAEGAGYTKAVRFDDIEAFDAELDDLLDADGPVLVELITQPTDSFFTAGPPPTKPQKSALARNWQAVREAFSS
ncbi:MAG TPA: thiamine pyrophosphate-dependent enzyme [Dehalococcoidia bacterium]|nr:thiamine pyrophosphate-dependent enzyme [Dehalococcoidia bacterium]